MIKRLFVLAMLVTVLFSCTVYKEFPIDVYRPGNISLPPDIRNVALISRNFKYNSDTLQNYYKSDYRLIKDKKNENLNIDSLAVTNAFEGLAANLKKNGKFNDVKIFPYNLIKPHKGNKLSIFNWEMVNNLTQPVDADVLISLETISYFFSEYKTSVTGELPSNEVITAAIWGIYDPVEKKIIDRKQMIDTVYWDGWDEESQKQKYDLPSRVEAIKMACKITGENYANRFTPSWQTVYRMYAVPPIEDFRLAAQYLAEGKWDKAINTWEIYAPQRFRKLAIDARYNMALGYEMKDNIKSAIEWINDAEKLAISLKSKEELKTIVLYKKVLLERQKELEKLTESENQ